MRLTLAALSLALLPTACRIDAPLPSSPAEDGSASNGRPGGTSGGQFFCQTDRGQIRPLLLRKLALRLTTRPGTVRSHLTMEVAGPAGERVEAVKRLAVPRGAAVTGAVLWMIDRRDPTGREILLAARLLVAADRNHDAVRVLSEWAAAMPAATAAELRRVGAEADAAEVLALAQRGR